MKTGKIRKRKKVELFDIVNTLILTFLMVIVLLPFYFTVVRSFMTQQDFMMNGASLWPEHFTLGNYRDIFVGSNMLRSFRNSVLYTVSGVAFSMFLTTTMAYGLSKKNYPGRALIQNMVIFTMYFGGGLIPFFLLIKDLGMMNTRWAVIIPLSFNVFNLIILRNFFEQLPPDLEESATLDGANPLQIFWCISLPLVKPALATLVLFFAVGRWNEWFHSSLFLGNAQLWPMQLELRQILWSSASFAESIPAEVGRLSFSEGIKAAAVMVTMLPIMCVYPFLQKYFVKGVMIGAIKS
ncbi:MAG: carbohydrate ABC transporter permease [Lachnospiraceae bacterium]|jgi:putative aldouronate transport system permease protein|nr:carbohydrate ABC transporter permease [Lachnospiraceae bacterium]